MACLPIIGRLLSARGYEGAPSADLSCGTDSARQKERTMACLLISGRLVLPRSARGYEAAPCLAGQTLRAILHLYCLRVRTRDSASGGLGQNAAKEENGPKTRRRMFGFDQTAPSRLSFRSHNFFRDNQEETDDISAWMLVRWKRLARPCLVSWRCNHAATVQRTAGPIAWQFESRADWPVGQRPLAPVTRPSDAATPQLDSDEVASRLRHPIPSPAAQSRGDRLFW